MGAVVGGEEQRPAHSGQGGRAVAAVAVAAGVDVLDQDRARLGAVRLPQLPAVGAVVGGEEQRAAHGGQVRTGRCRRRTSRVDVLDQDGARLGAVRLPQLPAVDAVVGGEEQRPPHIGEALRARSRGRAGRGTAPAKHRRSLLVPEASQPLRRGRVPRGRRHARQGDRSGCRGRGGACRPGSPSTTTQQLSPEKPGRERPSSSHIAVDGSWHTNFRDPAPLDVLDQDGAGLGAVRLPQLLAVDAVVGGEEQPARPPRVREVGRPVAGRNSGGCP